MLPVFHEAISGENGKQAYHILFRSGRNDEIREEYLSTGD